MMMMKGSDTEFWFQCGVSEAVLYRLAVELPCCEAGEKESHKAHIHVALVPCTFHLVLITNPRLIAGARLVAIKAG